MVIHLFCNGHLLVLQGKKMMVGLQMSIVSKLWLGKRLDKNFSQAKYDFTRAMGRTNYIMRCGVVGLGVVDVYYDDSVFPFSICKLRFGLHDFFMV
jgi:hypothetical protein